VEVETPDNQSSKNSIFHRPRSSNLMSTPSDSNARDGSRELISVGSIFLLNLNTGSHDPLFSELLISQELSFLTLTLL
jgi:hypothetical protein